MEDESSSLVVPATATLSNVRVTELDVNRPFSFYAQIGTEQELASFDEYSASLSAWCDQQKLGVSELPLVGAYLAVWSNTTLREDRGWFRAYVTKLVYKPSRQIECKLLDIGATQLVQLSNVCNQSPPMMYSMAAQARLCTLADVVKMAGTDVWSTKAISQFKELVTNEHTKQAVVLSQESDVWSLSIVIKTSDGWTSIGRLLAEDNLANYASSQLVLQAIDTLNSQCPAHPPPAILSFSSSDESSVHNSTDASSDKQPLPPPLSDTLSVVSNTISDASDHPPLSQLMSDMTLLKDSDNSISLSQNVGTHKHETVQVEEKAVESVNVPSIAPKQKALLQPFKKMKGVIVTESPAQVCPDVAMKEVKQKDERYEDQASNSAVQVAKDETKQVCGSTEVDTKGQRKEQAFASVANTSVVMKKDEEEPATSTSMKGNVTAEKPCSVDSNDDGFQADCDLSSSYSPSKESGLFISQFEVQKQRKRANLHACFTALMTESKTRESAPSISQDKKFQGHGRNPIPTNVNPFPDDQHLTGNASGRRTRRKQGKWGRQHWKDLGRHWLPRERQLAPMERPECQQQVYTRQPPPPVWSGVEYPVTPRAPQQDLNNLVEWLSRIILTETNKIVSAGFFSGEFMEKIKRVLSGSPAQKLSAHTGSSGPVQAVLKALILNAMKEPSLMEPMVQTIVVLHDHLTKDVSTCLQSVLEKQSKEKQFCTLLAKLYFTSLHSETLFPLVGAVVRHFLDTWVKCAPEADEQSSIADALLFAELCEAIGPTLDTSSKEILDEYFENIVRENILRGHLPRSVREVLLDLTNRRIVWIITGQQTGHDKSASPPQSTVVTSPVAKCTREFSTPSCAGFQKAVGTPPFPYKAQSQSPVQSDSTLSTQSQPLTAYSSTQSYPPQRAQGDSTLRTEPISTYSDPTHHSAHRITVTPPHSAHRITVTPPHSAHRITVTPPHSAHRITVTPPRSAQSLLTYSSAQDHSYRSAVTPFHSSQSLPVQHNPIGSAQGKSAHTLSWAQSPCVDQSLHAYSAEGYSAQNPLSAHRTRDNVHDYSTSVHSYKDQFIPAQGYSLYNTPPSSPSLVSQHETIVSAKCPQPNQTSSVTMGSKPSYKKDPQLQAPRNDLKSTLREAGIPSGAVLAILQYLDQKESEKTLSPAADHSQWAGPQEWSSRQKYH